MSEHFDSIAVVGAGAVGSFYGALLARAGQHVTLIGREAHVKAIEQTGLKLDMAGSLYTVKVDASTSLSQARSADLVLFCVKSTDTEATAQALASHLRPDAVVLTLQNGVENASLIARHVPNIVIPAVVYVATALPEPGLVRHFGRGDLVIGARGVTHSNHSLDATLQSLVAVFGVAGIDVRVSPDVMAELWSKLMINCAFNALSALGHANYAQIAALAPLCELQHDIVREVIAVAAADGVNLALDACLESVRRIALTMPGQFSSTAQDMTRRKPSEIDHLNGFIERRGRALGIPTPINRTLPGLVKLVESGYPIAASA